MPEASAAAARRPDNRTAGRRGADETVARASARRILERCLRCEGRCIEGSFRGAFGSCLVDLILLMPHMTWVLRK
ncbi:hypothetical protein BJX99DRAFT_237138 [Aspergillus californicus]